MSDYLYMLESHLDAGQNQAIAAMRRLATEADMNVWLTGGAMRDMLRGAPFRDLDFTVEHDAVKAGKALAAALSGHVVSEDPLKRWVEIELPRAVTVSVANARTEKYSKPGGKPVIGHATIHEDLTRRDFTINAIALSLSRGSRGLLVDPSNGQADLASREIRSTHSSIFFDDPARIFRLIRFQHLLGFEVVPRTKSQFDNALLENYQEVAAPEILGHEIRVLWSQPSVVQALEAYDAAGLLGRLSSSLSDGRWNSAGLSKFEEVKQSVIPAGTPGGWLAFVVVLTEKLSARDKAEVLKGLGMSAEESAAFKKLTARSGELEASLASSRVRKPSDVWSALRDVSTDEVLMVLYRSGSRAVQERIRAFYEKYLPLSLEVTDEEVLATGVKPGTPKFEKARQAIVVTRLNAKPPKVEPEGEAVPNPLEAQV